MNLYFNEIFMLCLFMILVPNVYHFVILVYIFFIVLTLMLCFYHFYSLL